LTEGDLLSIQEGIICHQVNCIGVMDAGIAFQIKTKYPIVFTQYKQYIDSRCKNILGSLQIVRVNKELSIANIFGQYDIRRIAGGERKTDYNAIDTSFKALKVYVSQNALDPDNVYIPEKMGCGLAGGNWDVYIAIVLQYFPNIRIMRK
jgi:hypothetical protein